MINNNSKEHVLMFRSLDPGAIGVTAPFEQSMDWAVKYGFEGISFPVGYALEKGVACVKEAFASRNLKPSVFGLSVDYRSDDAAFRSTFPQLATEAACASQAGVTRCSTWVLPGRKEMSDSDYFNLLKVRLGECARVLAGHGIRLGLEFLGPKTLRQSLGLAADGLYSAERMLDLVAAIGVPGTGLLLDAWHWHTSGGTTAVFSSLSNELVVDVHVNDAPAGLSLDELIDNKRCLPGATGVIDLAGFADGLRKIGYDGPVAVEPFSEELNALPDEQAVSVTAQALSRYF